jgi:YcxB-like protein
MNRSASLTLTADDYAAANQLHCVKCFRTPSALACLAMLVLAYVIWMTIAYIDRWGAIGVIALNAIFVAVVVLLIANFFLFIPISTRRTYRKHKALHRPYTYSWSETGLAVTSASGEWPVAWSDYLKWDENAQVFILYQAPRLFNILPKRALAPEQIVDLRQCAARIGA